jgi:hypothetical protein
MFGHNDWCMRETWHTERSISVRLMSDLASFYCLAEVVGTQAEHRAVGYEVGEKPSISGHWRVVGQCFSLPAVQTFDALTIGRQCKRLRLNPSGWTIEG